MTATLAAAAAAAAALPPRAPPVATAVEGPAFEQLPGAGVTPLARPVMPAPGGGEREGGGRRGGAENSRRVLQVRLTTA